MCGRYSLTPIDLERAFQERFGAVPAFASWRPRYNAAPTQTLPVILNEDPRAAVLAEWGLVPRWDPKRRLINSKCETVATKFRRAFERCRCLVPADSFYEWLTVDKVKTPQRFELEPAGIFAFAGVWEEGRLPDGGAVLRFSILTTEPNDTVRGVHNRMPVILPAEKEEQWLMGSPAEAAATLAPYPHPMRSYPVSRRLNSPRADDASLVACDEPEPPV